jgi:hypothetical protein
MLFDLRGSGRRNIVKGVYLTLALLMGGGLVLFGIGGDVSGGLFDAFSDRSSSGNQLVEDRIEENEDKVAENPKNTVALQALVRDWYQLAREEADPNTLQYTDEGKERLAEADAAWQQYLGAAKKPEPSLAQLMVQVYDPTALNQAADAAEAAEIVAVADPNPQAYINLTRYAALAGQDRKADLAGQKAVELAPKKDRKEVEAIVQQAKQPPASTTTQPAE